MYYQSSFMAYDGGKITIHTYISEVTKIGLDGLNPVLSSLIKSRQKLQPGYGL